MNVSARKVAQGVPVSPLAALAERCERATGPDRELDAAIAAVVHTKQLTYETGGDWIKDPEYTASLDAAMSLVPEGWNVGIFLRHAWPKQNAQVWHFDIEASTKHGDAATPALALCAAALRAKAAQ